jgi:hypothetical protein
MKNLITVLLLAASPALVLAQAAAPAAKPAGAKPTAKADAKPVAKKRAPISRSAAKAVEEVTPIDEDPNVTLNEADLAVARQVFVGDIRCELGASVNITASKRREGFFLVKTGNQRFMMHPVDSRTGAVRLEDGRRGAMWLQLGNKSMLMSQKLGQRLADECQSAQQVTFADELKRNPRPSILEALPPVVPTAPAEQQAPPPVAPAAASPAPASPTAASPAAPAAAQ